MERELKRGGVAVLEDFDLPSQAVTERLNSLFEPAPEFFLTEDISRAEKQVAVPSSCQVFATAATVPERKFPRRVALLNARSI